MTTVDVGPALARHRAERGFLRCTPPLMTDQMARNLLAYKYAGEDKSYLYVHVLTPMNAWLIQFVPMWCAPNFMSLVGLFVIGSAYALTWLYSHDMKQAIPPWLCLYSGLACFAYQTIDNLDGRQARRTGSSSPLGLLFDHGVSLRPANNAAKAQQHRGERLNDSGELRVVAPPSLIQLCSVSCGLLCLHVLITATPSG